MSFAENNGCVIVDAQELERLRFIEDASRSILNYVISMSNTDPEAKKALEKWDEVRGQYRVSGAV